VTAWAGATVSLVGQARPIGVTTAAVLQLLLAVTFLIMPIVVIRHGAKAQAAAEADVARQGFPPDVLVRNHVQFGEQAVGLLLPVAIALCLVGLAVLNLHGNEIGRIGSWIFQPILLVVGGLVTYRQAYATRFLESAFKKTGDPTLARIDVKAFVDAAMRAYPAWFLPVVRARFVLVTIGSVVIHILLTGPAASAYFD